MNDDTYAAFVCFIFQAEQNSNTGVSLLAHASGPLCIPITAAWQSDDVWTLSFDTFVNVTYLLVDGTSSEFDLIRGLVALGNGNALVLLHVAPEQSADVVMLGYASDGRSVRVVDDVSAYDIGNDWDSSWPAVVLHTFLTVPI